MSRKSAPARRQITYPGVYPYQTKTKGTLYRYTFDAPRKPDGSRDPRTRRGFATEQAAWEAMQEHKRELRLSGYVDPSNETLDQYFARWMRDTQHGRRPSSNRGYVNSWHEIPEAFRALPLVKITPTQVRALYADLLTRYKPSTAQLVRSRLRSVLAAAHRERLIPFDPSVGIPMKISRDAEAEASFDPENVWSIKEQVLFLQRTAAHPHHAMWRLMLDGGLRVGEALALTWADVDLEARTVRIQRTSTTDANGRHIIGKQPKTPTSRREIDLQPETVAALRWHATVQKTRRLECGPLWHPTNLVFDRGDGRLIQKSSVWLELKRTIAGIEGLRPLTPHGLRHTMAVTWIRAGVEPVAVSKRLGHSSVAFTLNVYAKVSREWQQSAMVRVAAFIKETG